MKKNAPKFTIVTVTYNAEEILEDTMLSVINQNFKDIEYIIIDGKSTDGTIDIVKKYEKYISYWISEPDNGIYDAMNKAIDKASGEWIAFMNAGDTYAGLDILSIVNKNIQKDVDFIYGGVNYVEKNGVISYRQPLDMATYIATTYICSHQSVFARTSIMNKYKFNTIYDICADTDFYFKVYKNGHKYSMIEIPIANYLDGGYSACNIERLHLEKTYIASKYVENFREVYDYWHCKSFFLKSNMCDSLPPNVLYNVFNRLISKIEEINNKYNNIILYGNSSLAKILSNFLKIKYKIADIKIQNDDDNLINPNHINKYDYDAIFITLLGREEVVEDYLKKIFIPNSKIKRIELI